MGKPQDLPAGVLPLRVGIFCAFITYVLALVGVTGMPIAVLTAVVDIGLLCLLFYVALQWFGKSERFCQAFAGFCGASMFINLAALPIYLSFGSGVDPAALSPDSRAMFDMANFVLMVWTIALLGHIVRHTFEVRMPISILIAYMYVMLLTFVLNVLFGSLGLVQSSPEQVSAVQLQAYAMSCRGFCIV